MSELSWYFATRPGVMFGFEVAHGRVVDSAPYGRKWLIGKSIGEAIRLLHSYGYEVKRGGP